MKPPKAEAAPAEGDAEDATADTPAEEKELSPVVAAALCTSVDGDMVVLGRADGQVTVWETSGKLVHVSYL